MAEELTMGQEMTLKLDGVTKLYGNGRGVEDISFALAPGEVLGLLGPNGSGKTTTMKAIAGLVRPTSGSIRICGEDAVDNHEAAMRHTGCLIESPALYDYLTPEQNLNLVARFYENVGSERIGEVLRMVDMDKYKNDKVRSFSLGMRQRVGLAAALLSKPRLLILDEPGNGLDIEGMLYVREVVKAASENGAAVLISSHLANEIQQCATRVAIIHGGKLLGCESINTVIEKFNSVEGFFLELINERRQGV